MNVQYHVARSVNYLIVGIRCGIGDETTSGVEQVGGPPGKFRRDGIDRWKQETVDCPSVIEINTDDLLKPQRFISTEEKRRVRDCVRGRWGPYVGGTYSMGDGAPRWR